MRYGPAFFLGNTFPILLEALASPMEKSGLPSGGRRALSFSDSRQGTARLAAKLQQESERTLTRAFLYHTVQERRGPTLEERALIERKLEAYRRDPIICAENIDIEENKLKAQAEPVPWDRLVEQFASQSDLRDFAGDVWQERMRGGRQMAEEPARLAEMFLYRELFRRPKVQNNPETMGLPRLVFPVVEQRARANTMPLALREAGVDSDGWIGLVAAAIDFGFRDNLAVDMPDAIVRWVAPRGGTLQGICAPGLAPQDRPEGNARYAAQSAYPGSFPNCARPALRCSRASGRHYDRRAF